MFKFLVIAVLLNFVLDQVYAKNVKCLANIEGYEKVKSFDNLERLTDSTCAQCYWFMRHSASHWKKGSIVNRKMHPVFDPSVYMCFHNTTTTKFDCHPFKYSGLNLKNKENDFYLSQFESKSSMDTFLKCCSDAKNCCENTQATVNTTNSKNCPTEWDGRSCWNSAKPDTTETNVCPDMYYKDSDCKPTKLTQKTISKKCTSNGTWQVEDVSYKTCKGACDQIFLTAPAPFFDKLSLSKDCKAKVNAQTQKCAKMAEKKWNYNTKNTPPRVACCASWDMADCMKMARSCKPNEQVIVKTTIDAMIKSEEAMFCSKDYKYHSRECSFDNVIKPEPICPNKTIMEECVKKAERDWAVDRNQNGNPNKNWCSQQWQAFNCQMDFGKMCKLGTWDHTFFNVSMTAIKTELSKECKEWPQIKL